MNAMLDPAVATSDGMSMRRVVKAYVEEMRSECLRYARNPGFIVPVLIFSCMFYLLFVVVLTPPGSDAGTYMLASYSVFGVMSPGLFGFGVSLATERDNGLLTLKRALPMPPAAYLLGKMVMAMAAAAIVVLLLVTMAFSLGHASLSGWQVLELFVTDVPGVLPFCALGMWLGTLIKGQGAPGLLNLVYLPMSFLSGLWVPLPMLPEALQRLAPVFPSYHLAQIALNAVGMQQAPVWPHVIVLIGFTLVFLGLAVRRLRRHG